MSWDFPVNCRKSRPPGRQEKGSADIVAEPVPGQAHCMRAATAAHAHPGMPLPPDQIVLPSLAPPPPAQITHGRSYSMVITLSALRPSGLYI